MSEVDGVIPLPGNSFFLNRIREALRGGGRAAAFRYRGDTVTYAEAAALLDRLDGALGAAGLGAGEVLAIVGGNRPETLLTQLAAQLRGAAVLPLAVSAAVPDRIAAVRAAGAATLVLDPDREPATAAEFAAAAGAGRVFTFGPPPAGLPPNTRDLLDLQGETTRSVPAEARMIFPSGGTTGTPKLIRHSGIYEAMAHIFAPSADGPQRVLLVAPMSHLTGNTTALGALLRGDTTVLHDGFDAGAVLAAIEAERVNILSLTPPRLARLLDHPDRAGTDTSSLTELALGAAPLPPRRLAQALECFGPVVGQGYGLTEAPMVATIKPAELTGHPERLESVGRIVPGMSARVVGPAGEPLPTWGVGEIQVRGLALMDGYQDRQRDTAAFTDGWLRTGDIGYLDAGDYLYLLDRADDVIVTGDHGTKVYPARLEGALATHPRVRQAAVFGVPGPDGERVHATVVPTEPGSLSAAEVRAHLRSALGHEHFVPASVRFAGTLPLTPIGKVDKKALRAAHEDA